MSTIYTITRNDVIKAAMRKLQVLAKGQTPDTEDYTNASLALNLIIKEFQTDGMQLWKKLIYTFTPVAGTTQYAIGEGQTLNTAFPLKLHQAFLNDTSGTTRIPLQIISHQNYYLLPRNSSSGRPVQLMYQPFIDYGQINLWPTPDSSTASNYTVSIVYQAPFTTLTSGTDVPDFPAEWGNALIYRLAVDLAPEWTIPLSDRQLLASEAREHHERALSFGTEEASFFIQPDYIGRYDAPR